MKNLWKVLAVLLCLTVLITLLGPQILLKSAMQPAVETEYAYSEAFCTTYDQVRERLQQRVQQLKAAGVATEQESFPVDAEDDLYIDTLYLPSNGEKTNLVVLTTGVHGMEGYIGSVMLDVFFEEIYPTLDLENTAVLVVANVNPYGMKYYRRYNENNVDLNRNFILDWTQFDRAANQDYPKVVEFLGPTGQMGNALWHEAGFWLKLGKEAVTTGADTISNALLGGQYEYPQGVYYGGWGDEVSTAYLKDVFARTLDSDYNNIIHIDLHSGYGPRYNMVIFNSVYETLNEAESQEAFGYDYVIAYDSEAFYATTGDTTDFYYRLAEQMGSSKTLYSTCFEFGTIGDDFMDTILSLKYTVDENQQHWYPTDNATTAQMVQEHYKELYYPTETQWREKTIADFRAAAMGVLENKLQ